MNQQHREHSRHHRAWLATRFISRWNRSAFQEPRIDEFWDAGPTASGSGRREGSDHGFLLFDGSDGNTLKGNPASDNAARGFFLADSDGNTLTGNTAIDNDGWGFLVDEVLANMFLGNVCNGNGLGGSNQPGIC